MENDYMYSTKSLNRYTSAHVETRNKIRMKEMSPVLGCKNEIGKFKSSDDLSKRQGKKVAKSENCKKCKSFNHFLRNPDKESGFKVIKGSANNLSEKLKFKSKIIKTTHSPQNINPEVLHLKSIIKHLLSKVETLEKANKTLQNPIPDLSPLQVSQNLYISHLESKLSPSSHSLSPQFHKFSSEIQEKYLKQSKELVSLNSHYSTLYQSYSHLYNLYTSQVPKSNSMSITPVTSFKHPMN